MKILKRSLLGLTMLIMIQVLVISPSYAQQLQITSPSDGTIVRPGQSITILVSADHRVGDVWIFPSHPLPDVRPGTTPNSFVLTLPPGTPVGVYYLTAVGSLSDKDSRVGIHVERSDYPTSIYISPIIIQFDNVGDQIPLQVFGLFEGNSVNLTNSAKIKYTVANSKIATITPYGLVTGRSPGGTTVTATYAAVSSSIPVQVPLGNATPVYKVTAAPTGSISKDQFGNYVINMNITNNSNVPLAHLTLTDCILNKTAAATIVPTTVPNLVPNASTMVSLGFAATAGSSKSKAVLQLRGTYVGSLPNGGRSQPGAVNFTFRVPLP